MARIPAPLRAVGILAVACSGTPPDVAAFSNDPLCPRQGYMPLIGVPQGWAHATAPVVVAVLDNGVDIGHPDLRAKIWTDPKETDIHGWNFLDDTADVGLSAADLQAPDFDHGTSVAGIIGAETNNAEGVAACCPQCALMILKARDFWRTGSVLPRFSAAVDYAIAHGARVLNVSDGALVGSIPDALVTELEAAAQRAEQAGMLIVASAGNDAANSVRWPARVPTVLAVAAVDWYGAPTSWTSFGAEVSVAAPGVFIETTKPNGGYDYFEGTSASAPVTSALAAMIFSQHPDWSPAQVRARIQATAHAAQLAGRPDVVGYFGAGVVSFADALAE